MRMILSIILLNGTIPLALATFSFRGIMYHDWQFLTNYIVVSASCDGESAYDNVFLQLFCFFFMVMVVIELCWFICKKSFSSRRDKQDGL